jgi:hypothetical protein
MIKYYVSLAEEKIKLAIVCKSRLTELSNSAMLKTFSPGNSCLHFVDTKKRHCCTEIYNVEDARNLKVEWGVS